LSALDDAMNKSQTTDEMRVYRGVENTHLIFGEPLPAEDATGFTWTDEGFPSTTVNEDTPNTFANTEKGAAVLSITVPTGTGALKISNAEDEGEVLLDRGLTFQVTKDRGVVDGRRHLDVRVVEESVTNTPPETPEPDPTDSQPTAEINGIKTIDTSRLSDVLYRESGAISAADLQNLAMTHTTKTPDVLRQEGFDPRKGSGHGQLLGRGTYIALDQATAQLYQDKDTTTLPVKINPDAKFLSVNSKDEYGMLSEAAKMLPGGEARWLALTAKWKAKGDPEPEAAALRQIAVKEGWDGMVVRAPHAVNKDIYGFAGGGNQVVVWTPDKVHLNEVTPTTPTFETAPSMSTELTTQERVRLNELQKQIQQLHDDGAYAREIDAKMTHKSGTGGILTDWDIHQQNQARDKLEGLRVVAAELAEEELALRIKRDGAPWGSSDADDARWAQAGKPSTLYEPGVDRQKMEKIADSYRINDKKTIEHNASLRTGEPTPAAKSWRTRISRLINSQRIQSDSVVYRGAALRPEMLMNFRPGAILRDRGTMSTDEDRGTAQFYVKTRANGLPGTIPLVMELRVSKGTPAADVAYGEYVFDVNTPIRVISSSRDDQGIVQVVAEVLTPEQAKEISGG
jgi:ADP-ribosyltransferase exoenzyme